MARRALVPGILAALLACVAAGCGDDGADVREQADRAGSVGVIGPAPEGGGASVSAVASGCTTRGATTLLATSDLEIGLDEWSITVQDGTAGVVRIVAKNFGDLKHEVVIMKGSSTTGLPMMDGVVDIDAATPAARFLPFAGNTICQAPFELGPGSYVVFDNQPASEESGGSAYRDHGMVASFTLS